MRILGLISLFIFAFIISENKRKINLRLVIGVILLELIIVFLLFKLESGLFIFQTLNKSLITLVEIANEGARFLFGPLSIPPGKDGSLGFILFFQALPTIVFFSALVSVLYHFKIMNFIIELFAKIFTKLFRISGAESLVAASNIFVGIESILTVSPLLKKMTRSELHTILTAGLSTVSSNVLAIYIFSLQDVFPQIAGHLVIASILSAPAAILFSKIIIPETETPETLGTHIKVDYQKYSSFIEAIINGSNNGLKLIFGIVALLLSVIGIVNLADHIIKYIFNFFNVSMGLKDIFSYLFYPFIWLIGISGEDVYKISLVVGERLILTEVISYMDLANLLKNKEIQFESAIITTYILCGFTHFASLAIFVGGILSIVPEKTKEIASITFKSLIASNLAGLFTGVLAGMFANQSTLIK